MLYGLLELTQLALSPLHLASHGLQRSLSSPLNPLHYHPLARMTSASHELFTRLTARYRKPAFGIDSTEVAGVPVEVIERNAGERAFARLLHFDKQIADKGPRLLIVAPLSGHHATLLRNTVEVLLPDHDVFITDWTDAGNVPVGAGAFDLSSFTRYVQDWLRQLGPDVHVMAVCQPSVAVLAAVALMAQNGETTPASLTLMAGPVDPRCSPTEVTRFALSHPLDWFRSNVIQTVPFNKPGRMRQVYPGFLQLTGFVSMNPGLHRDAWLQFYNDLLEGDDDGAEAHRRFYDEYNAVLDLPAEFYLETIGKVFQTFDLPEGRLELCGQRVDPAAIRSTALLTIEGERDDITGHGQTHAAHALCTGLPDARHRQYTAEGVGHYGVFSGSRFRERVAPVIRSFIRDPAR